MKGIKQGQGQQPGLEAGEKKSPGPCISSCHELSLSTRSQGAVAVRARMASVGSTPKKFVYKGMERNRAEAGEQCEVKGRFQVSSR